MSKFDVSFMKDVLGDNGRQVEICQRTCFPPCPDPQPRRSSFPRCRGRLGSQAQLMARPR